MKITPSAIRQKSFETGFRGFEKKEVASFLEEISEIVDALHKENMDLKSKLQQTESEAKRLKDVEDSLFRTLKTAEDTGAAIIEEANEAADLIISEANETAESATAHANKILSSANLIAERDAAMVISAAETKAKETIVELRESMQGLVRSYEGLAEQREVIVKNLKRIAQESLNQIDLSDAHFSRIDAKAHQRAIDELSRSQAFTFANLDSLTAEVGKDFGSETTDESDPLVEMEIIEETSELEIHDDSPNMEMEVKKEVIEIKTEVKIELLAEEEKEEEPVKMEKSRVEIQKPEQNATEEEKIKKSDSSKNESGSFFDHLD
jgi:cell division initiation protein